MTRIYSEIRISHRSGKEKEAFEKQLDDKVKEYGFSNRAEYIRVVALNANIKVDGGK
jgi:hypothetical protein